MQSIRKVGWKATRNRSDLEQLERDIDAKADRVGLQRSTDYLRESEMTIHRLEGSGRGWYVAQGVAPDVTYHVMPPPDDNSTGMVVLEEKDSLTDILQSELEVVERGKQVITLSYVISWGNSDWTLLGGTIMANGVQRGVFAELRYLPFTSSPHTPLAAHQLLANLFSLLSLPLQPLSPPYARYGLAKAPLAHPSPHLAVDAVTMGVAAIRA
eukprot:Sspe_Gene.39700::Locus_19142_Transcript_1_1_Confidence_1.000_Length_716::g.39700::m.39700